MESPIYRAAMAEIDRLKRELMASDAAALFREFLKAEEVARMYAETAGISEIGKAMRANVQAPAPESAPARGRPANKESESGQVVAAAERYFKEHGGRKESGDLVEILEGYGVEIGGESHKKKAARVSAYLSAAKDIFDNIRGKGYGLKVLDPLASIENATAFIQGNGGPH